MKKRIIIIGIILIIVVVLVSLIGTFASDSTVATNDNSYDITLTGSTGEISVPAGTSKTALYQLTNTNKGVVKYGIAYSGDNITVKVYEDTIDPETGLIDYGENKFVKLYIENSGTTDSIASIQAVLGYEHGGELIPIITSGYTLVTEIYSPPTLPTLISHINNLYINNKDATPVTNNGIEYTYASIYDKDDDDTTSGGLMNDRLGNSEVGSDAGNIRYYGANPLNYIDIGDVYTEDVTIDNFEKNEIYLVGIEGISDRDKCYERYDDDMCGIVEKKQAIPNYIE